MKNIKLFEEFSWDQPRTHADKPDIFMHTIYRIPTKDELEDVNSFSLDADEIYKGFGYTIIGRGIRSKENKDMIIKSIEILCAMYPSNEEYKSALDMSKSAEVDPRFK